MILWWWGGLMTNRDDGSPRYSCVSKVQCHLALVQTSVKKIYQYTDAHISILFLYNHQVCSINDVREAVLGWHSTFAGRKPVCLQSMSLMSYTVGQVYLPYTHKDSRGTVTKGIKHLGNCGMQHKQPAEEGEGGGEWCQNREARVKRGRGGKGEWVRKNVLAPLQKH